MLAPPVGPAPSAAPRRSIVGEIRIYHSAVERGSPFLRLAVYARDDDFAPGLPFILVRDACFILANNTAGRFEKWQDVAGGEQRSYTRVVLDDEGLLEPGEYTYLVDGDPNYAACPSFRMWTLPRLVPPHWQGVDGVTGVSEIFGGGTKSSASENALALDKCCAVTGAIDRLQACRLVPSAENDWWKTHLMYQHAASLFNSTTTTSTNLLTMRSDLTTDCFDDAHFLLYPYQGKWVTFFASERSTDLAFDHHFRATRIPERIHPVFLYARFAWNVFKLAEAYLEMLVEELSYVQMVPLKRTASQPGGRATSGIEASEATLSTCGSPSGAALLQAEDSINVLDVLEKNMAERGIETMGEVYMGIAQTWRVAEEYRRSNPSISAVQGTEFAEVDEDNEQDLTGIDVAAWPYRPAPSPPPAS